jgi:hypothetical protein
MQINAGKLQILTVAAMLVIVSGGIAAYAQNQPLSSLPAGSSPVAMGGNDTNSTSSSSSSSASSSSSSLTTSTLAANQTLCQPPAQTHPGRLVLPITAVGQQASTGGLSFSDGRGCYASITTVGGVFSVKILLRYAKPVTEYSAVLVANGTTYTLGNMVAGPDGNGQMANQVLLKPGTWNVSIRLFDISSNPGQSTLVLQTGQGTVISPPFPAPGAGHTDNSTREQSPNPGHHR